MQVAGKINMLLGYTHKAEIPSQVVLPPFEIEMSVLANTVALQYMVQLAFLAVSLDFPIVLAVVVCYGADGKETAVVHTILELQAGASVFIPVCFCFSVFIPTGAR